MNERRLIYVHVTVGRNDEDLAHIASVVQTSGGIPIIPEIAIRLMRSAEDWSQEDEAMSRGRMAFLMEACDELWIVGDAETWSVADNMTWHDKRILRLAEALHKPIRRLKYTDMLALKAAAIFGRRER